MSLGWTDVLIGIFFSVFPDTLTSVLFSNLSLATWLLTQPWGGKTCLFLICTGRGGAVQVSYERHGTPSWRSHMTQELCRYLWIPHALPDPDLPVLAGGCMGVVRGARWPLKGIREEREV